MRGKSVLCNGTTYELDMEGEVEVDDAEDAEKMLSAREWVDADNMPIAPRAPVKERAKGGSGAVQLIGKDGKTMATKKDPPIPADGEDWADPDPGYSIEWLKACADAYEVSYGKTIKPKTLADRIKKAMYTNPEE
jgi:hypothetical protein